MPEDRVLAAVVHVQVGVDDQRDVTGNQVVVPQRLGGRAVHHPPVGEQPVGPSDPGVDQNAALRVHDHEAVDRPAVAVRGLQAGQVQPADLQALATHRSPTGMPSISRSIERYPAASLCTWSDSAVSSTGPGWENRTRPSGPTTTVVGKYATW